MATYKSKEIEEAIRDNENFERNWLKLSILKVYEKAVGKVAFIVFCKHYIVFVNNIFIYSFIKEMLERWDPIVIKSSKKNFIIVAYIL